MKLRRVNIVHDFFNVFMEQTILNVDLKIELIKEKAADSVGVSRGVHSPFWEHCLEEREGEKYPDCDQTTLRGNVRLFVRKPFG